MADRPTVSIRFSAAEIAARVDVMADELAAKLPADTLVVSVLKGSFVFAADLIRALSRAGANWSMDFLTLSSYGTGTQSSGNVRIVRDIVDDVRERDVLLVDDILESGLTLSFAKNLIQERGGDAALGALTNLMVDLVEMVDHADLDPFDAVTQQCRVVGEGAPRTRRVARVVAG